MERQRDIYRERIKIIERLNDTVNQLIVKLITLR